MTDPTQSAIDRMPRAISIRATMWLIGAAVLVALLSVSSYIVVRSARHTDSLELSILLNAAVARAEATESFLDHMRMMLQQIAQRPQVRALDRTHCDPIMGEIASFYPVVVNLNIRTTTGEQLCDHTRTSTLSREEVITRPWFREAIANDGFHVSNALFGKISGRPIFFASHPVHDRAGNRAAAIFVSVSLDSLDRLVDASRLPQGASAALIDRSGSVLSASQDSLKWRGEKIGSAMGIDPGALRGNGFARAKDQDGLERMYALARIASHGWLASVYVPADRISKAISREIGQAAIVSAVLLAMFAALLYAVSRLISEPIRNLRDFVRAASAAPTPAQIKARGPAEVRELTEEFNRALAVRERTEAKLKDALGRLARQRDQLLSLSHRLAVLQEKERRDVARELHDRVGPNLTVLNINFQRLHGDPGATDDARRLIADSQALLYQTGLAITDVLTELKPPMLANYGLLDALRFHAREFSHRTGLVVDVAGSEARLAGEIEMALFRISLAALNNAAQHAKARHISITIDREGPRLRLEICDDGVGFDVEKALRSGRWGLTAMVERAEVINAILKIDSSPGQGTRVMVELDADK